MKLTHKVIDDIIALLPKGLIYIEDVGDHQTSLDICDGFYIKNIDTGLIKTVCYTEVVRLAVSDYLLSNNIDSSEWNDASYAIRHILHLKFMIDVTDLSDRNFEL